MIVYLFVGIFALLVQFVPITHQKQYWWRTVISLVPLFLFMALRHDYGFDEDAYHSFYNGVHTAENIFNVSDHMEKGYTILNKVMPSYQWLIAVISLINCWALSFLIYRYVPHKYSWLAIILLFFTPSTTIFFMISGIRNGLAASILILSTFFLVGEKKRLFPYVLLGAVAASIHTSAIAMFVVCYLLNSPKSLTKRGVIIWIVVLLLASMASLSSLAETALPVIEYFMGRYVEQVEGLAEMADGRGFMGSLAGILLAAGILLYISEGNRSRLVNDYDLTKYKWALFYCFSYTLGILGGRMGQYMLYYFIVASVSLFAYWNKPLFKYGYLIIILYLFRLTLINWLSNPLFPYWTYKSILGNI